MSAVGPNPEVAWYFDFISPFAYLQHETLKVARRNRPEFQLNPIPVLFAGILQHHDHKGPAEIEPKRRLTYRFCQWYADRHGIEFRMPAIHPFNPLPFLRLAIARDSKPDVVDQLFRYIWVKSADDPNFASLESIESITGFENASGETSSQLVKDQLRANTEEAISRGVFGVPTLRIGTELFWGTDMTAMALDYLSDRSLFDSARYSRIDHLPAVDRRR